MNLESQNTIEKQSRQQFNALLIVIAFAAIASLFFIGFYIYTFADSQLSHNPDAWGTFGDFLGGTLNPMISLINLSVTIWIALTLNKYSARLHQQQIQTQKELTLIQIRSEAFKELRKDFNEAFAKWDTDKTHAPYVIDCINVLDSFLEAYSKLFKLDKSELLRNLFEELKACEKVLVTGRGELLPIHYINARLLKGQFYASLVSLQY